MIPRAGGTNHEFPTSVICNARVHSAGRRLLGRERHLIFSLSIVGVGIKAPIFAIR
jgi:hypothetical protein